MPETTTKKSEAKGRGRPRLRRKSFTIYARVRPELGDAMQEYINANRPRVGITAIVEDALEDWLERKGYIPSAPG